MPASDPITAVANAISALTGVGMVFLKDHEAQKYDDQFQGRLGHVRTYFTPQGEVADRDGLGADVRQLCLDAGQAPILGLSNEAIELPLQDFLDLYAAAAAGVRDRAKANSLLDSLTSK